jgi:hypothetical protein
MLNRISPRERKLIGATLAVLSAGGGYLGVYENLRKRWSDLKEEISMREQKLHASIQSYLEEGRIEKEYDEIVASLRIEGDDTDKQIKIMQELSAIMLEAGVSPKNAKPLNIDEEDKFQVFNFSYDDTETNMVDLTRFLDLLEKRSKVSEIQALEIKTPSPPLYAPGEQRFKTSFKISRLVYRS